VIAGNIIMTALDNLNAYYKDGIRGGYRWVRRENGSETGWR
jgi:hypothetical protein